MDRISSTNRRIASAVNKTWHVLLSIALVCFQAVYAQAATNAIANDMRSAATDLITATPAGARNQLLHAFDIERRNEWHYTPRSRDGIALKDMNAAQRQAALRLLQAPLSADGYVKIQDQMALEIVLRKTDFLTSLRVAENYAIAIFGTPNERDPWGWRIEGHHLSLHFTMDANGVVTTLPQFMGANPATVGQSVKGAPKVGKRVLGEEEDAARALFASLSIDQRTQAWISEQTYGDIQSGASRKAVRLDNSGVTFGALTSAQQAQLLKVIELFAAHLKPALMEQSLQRVRAGGLESITFAWVGSQEPKRGHYFRIQGAQFLIEYDNSGGNHVHTVWRDFEGDWGRDVLAEHYRKAGGKAKHRHD
jgi:hypothetical protein